MCVFDQTGLSSEKCQKGVSRLLACGGRKGNGTERNGTNGLRSSTDTGNLE